MYIHNNEELINEYLSTNLDTVSKNSLSVSIAKNNIKLLYSYSTVISIYDIKKNIVFISRFTYSNTTGKQLSLLRNNITTHDVIYLETVNNSFNDIYKLLYKELIYISDLELKQKRARVVDYTDVIISLKNNLSKILDYFDFDKRKTVVKKAYDIVKGL